MAQLEHLFQHQTPDRFKIFDANVDRSGLATTQETIPSPEAVLLGKVIVVTGGIRGIGKEVTDRLVRLGATVLTPHRDPKKEGRANRGIKALEDQGAAGKMVSFVCDLTKQDEVQDFAIQVRKQFGKVDAIIHNAAGGMEEWADDDYAESINATAKLNLTLALDPLLPDRTAQNVDPKDAPMVIEDTSAWSKYYPLMYQLPDYERVAKSKKSGELLLTDEVRSLNTMRTNRIRRAEVCGHAIEGTPTIDGFRRRYPEKMAEIEKTAIDGKFPHISQMADAIVGLVVNGFEDGHVEFVGVPHTTEAEVKVELPLYNRGSRKLKFMAEPQPGLTFGHYTLLPHDLLPVSTVAGGKLVMTPQEQINTDKNLPDAVFKADQADVEGHFGGEGNPKIVPLWKLIAAVYKTAALRYKELTGDDYFVALVRDIGAKSMVLPEDNVEIYLKPNFVGEAGYELVDLGVDLKIGNSVVGTIDALTIRRGFDPDEDLKAMVLEAAALTNGLDALHQKPRENVVPLFTAVKSIEYADPEETPALGVGTELVTESNVSSNTSEGFVAQAITRIGLADFARADGLACDFMDRDRAIALYEVMVQRRQRQRERQARKEAS